MAGVEADGGDSELVTITSAPVLPDAEEDETYAFTLDVAGGSPPYLWTLTGEGALPPGINLTSGGTVRGTAPIDGTYTFEVRATDTEGESAEATFSLAVLGDVEGALPARAAGGGERVVRGTPSRPADRPRRPEA